MDDPILMKFGQLHEGVLIKRYKRFLADVRLENGEVVTAHCPNTGPMQGVIQSEGKVRLSFNPSPSRKLAWTWQQSEVVGQNGNLCWVGVNTLLANKIVRAAIENGFLEKELGKIKEISQEKTYGVNRKSRIDLLLDPVLAEKNDHRKIFVEVKNTTWAKNKLAFFPDTITKRGQKHLCDLISVLPSSRAVLVFCITRNDIDAFSPGDSADKDYGRLFREAIHAGVEIIPASFSFYSDCIKWSGIKKLAL